MIPVRRYLVPPLLLPVPELLPLEPLLGAVLGEVLGDVLMPPLLLPVPPLLLPVLPLLLPLAAPAPEPDLLKWASHSEREIDPSLLVSTDEKLGSDVLVLLLPDADGVEEEPLLPLVPEEELCATATLDSASSAAAVAALNSFKFNIV